MTDKPVPSGFARPLTFEQMSEAQRRFYDPRRRTALPETIHEYHPLVAYDDEVQESFHRKKPE